MSIRQFSTLDEVIMRLDSTLLGLKKRTSTRKKREFPAKSCANSNLSLHEKRHVSGLMRVNHAGEIAAQALYKAQSLTVRDDKLQEIMKESAEEEFDHLYWCEKRLDELGEDISRLTPFWYLGSFCIGFQQFQVVVKHVMHCVAKRSAVSATRLLRLPGRIGFRCFKFWLDSHVSNCNLSS